MRKGAPLPLPSGTTPESTNPLPNTNAQSLSRTTQYKLTAALLVFLSAWFAWSSDLATRQTPFVFSDHTSGSSSSPAPPLFTIQEQQSILARCASLHTLPGPAADFHVARDTSDRFEPGTRPTLIRNASIFTGEQNGTVTYRGDVLLDRGIVRAIGDVPGRVIDKMENLTVVEARGRWVTPGLGTFLF